MRTTPHAYQRSIQRNIPAHIMSVIHAYGSSAHSKGAVSLTLDDESISLAADGCPRRRNELSRYRGAYLVVSGEDRVITVARRLRHFRR